LETFKALGHQPNFEASITMSTGTYRLILPTSVENVAAELARVDGVSLNQLIAAAGTPLMNDPPREFNWH
jgi:hypothetical protein